MKKSERIDGLPLKSLKELELLHGIKFNPINRTLIKKIIRPRPTSGHKGIFGHALVIAGSEGTTGAAILASKAALRAGCGLVTTSIPPNAEIPLLSGLPEAMTKMRKSHQDVRDLDLAMYDAIGFGPGVGVTDDSTEILSYLLEHYKGPLIIDADGLTILSRHKSMYELLNENIILTPHPAEFSRLCLTDSGRKDLINTQLNFQKEYKCVVLLKGKNTTVVNHSGIYYNTTGNSGMATAGSGDVLTGIIASLCAQDYVPAEAALVGTFMHGFAGDVAAKEGSLHSLIASDIINSMKSFFKKFETST